MTATFQPVLLGQSPSGIVYQLTNLIAVKRGLKGMEPEDYHANEQKFFEFLESIPPIPHLVRCIYREQYNIFLELAPNGSLKHLLNKYQTRNENAQVLTVSHKFHRKDVHRWMQQLCRFSVAFEEAGIVHGDLSPCTLLFDNNWDLVVCNLGHSLKNDEFIYAMMEPFGRLLNESEGEYGGSYGIAGPRIDIFSIGSIYYTLLHGYQPYEMEYWGVDHDSIMQDKFQQKEFPLLTDSMEDAIIRKCWDGKYQSSKELLMEFMDGTWQDVLPVVDKEWLAARQSECKQIVLTLDSVLRFLRKEEYGELLK